MDADGDGFKGGEALGKAFVGPAVEVGGVTVVGKQKRHDKEGVPARGKRAPSFGDHFSRCADVLEYDFTDDAGKAVVGKGEVVGVADDIDAGKVVDVEMNGVFVTRYPTADNELEARICECLGFGSAPGLSGGIFGRDDAPQFLEETVGTAVAGFHEAAFGGLKEATGVVIGVEKMKHPLVLAEAGAAVAAGGALGG